MHNTFKALLPPATKLGQGDVFTGVCDSVKGGSASEHAGIPPPQTRHPPGKRPPQEQTSPGGDPPGAEPPGSRPPGPGPREETPRSRHPPVQSMLGYGQHAGSTHPTGMQSCFLFKCSVLTFLPPANEVWGKVMFLHLCVTTGICLQGGPASGWGVSCMGGLGRPPQNTWDTTGYGQQAGGTHPTGMNSCPVVFFTVRKAR